MLCFKPAVYDDCPDCAYAALPLAAGFPVSSTGPSGGMCLVQTESN